MSKADPQCDAVYSAHEELRSEGLVFRSIREVADFVNMIVRTPWWQKRSEAKDVAVVEQSTEKDWSWSVTEHKAATLGINRFGRCEVIVYHELAHALCPSSCQWHGPVFAREFLRVTRRFNPAMGRKLQEAFDRHGVRVAEEER